MNTNFIYEISHYCNVSLNGCSAIKQQKIDYYDFTFVLEGTMTYTANGKRLVLDKNDALFLPPGTIRTREKVCDPVKFVSFNFNVVEGTSFPFDIYMRNCITPDIRRLVAIYPHEHFAPGFHSKEKCVHMLSYILLELIDIYPLPGKNEHVIKIMKYIDEHITEPLSLCNIASHFNLSKEYVSYIFRRESGLQLVYYINKQKSLLAKKLIQSETMSLSDIAEYLGFENYDYFSKTFKKHIGISPSRIKQRL